MYKSVTVICCYLTLTFSEAVQIKVTTTAINLAFILLKNLLKNYKTVRKVGADRLHVIFQADYGMSGQNAVFLEFQENGSSFVAVH